MTFITPITGLLAAAVTVPLLVGLYFLKLRRRPMAVPSTLLWKKAVQDLQVNAPFQRLRNNLLLWLQLLLLALLLLAMARPAGDSVSVTGERVVIVVDHSGSMRATDVGPSRLDEAKREALRLVDAMDSSAAGMVVAFAERATVRQSFTTDHALLRRAIQNVEPTDQRSRLSGAIALIEPHTSGAPGSPDTSSEGGGGLSVFVIGDGRTHADAGESSALPGADLTFVPVGRGDADNVGIVACAARRESEAPERVEVFVRLANYGPKAQTANVTLTLDGRKLTTRRVRVPGAAGGLQDENAGEGVSDASSQSSSASGLNESGTGFGEPGARSVTFRFTRAGSGSIEVSHDHADALEADNTARLELTASRRLRVLLVTPGGNPFIPEALVATGIDELRTVTPEQYDAEPAEHWGHDGEGFDVMVFDRHSPAAPPAADALWFAAAPPLAGLELRESSEDAPEFQRILTWSRSEPVMRYVALDDVIVRRPGRLVLPVGARVLAMGLEGPMLAELVEPGTGRRHVVVSFDVLQSRWPINWSYQVFMVNAMDVLGLGTPGDTAALGYATGQAVSVPVHSGAESPTTTVRYDGPENLTATVRAGRAALPAFAMAGWYTAERDAVDPPFDRLAVNLLDPIESDLRPAVRVDVSASTQVSAADEAAVRREWWPWLAWAALGMLGVEWWVYNRRMRV